MEIDKVVEHYVGLRDKVKQLEADTKAQTAPLKEQMEKIEGALQLYLEQQGATSIKTTGGTPYISQTKKAKVAEWEPFEKYLVEQQATHLLTKSVSSSAVLEAIEEGESIPGIAVVEITKLNVRRN